MPVAAAVAGADDDFDSEFAEAVEEPMLAAVAVEC